MESLLGRIYRQILPGGGHGMWWAGGLVLYFCSAYSYVHARR